MHIQSIYTGLHHRNLEHKGCTFKSMHRPTMRIVVLKKKSMFLVICNYTKLNHLLFEIVNAIDIQYLQELYFSFKHLSLQCQLN